MSVPKEHDYIGLSETPPARERVSEKLSSSTSSSIEDKDNSSSSNININGNNNNANINKSRSSCLNMKDTELRLGLPGCHSPERKPQTSVSLFGKDIDTKNTNGFSLESPILKSSVSGSKRGFADAITGKWLGSEADLGRSPVSFSARSENCNAQKSCAASGPVKKEVAAGLVGQAPKPAAAQEKYGQASAANENSSTAPAAKAQVVGWPPIRSFRKNTMANNLAKINEDAEGYGCLYVKVSMDGAPYLRKVDLKTYSNYAELSSALEKMFSCFTIGQCGSHGLPGRDGLSESRLKDLLHGSEYVLTYQDKDGDWMLVGDVPWQMFTDSCWRLRIMKGSEAIGLAPRAMLKCKNRN